MAVVRSGTFTAGAHVSSLVGEAAQHRQRKKSKRKGEGGHTRGILYRNRKIS